MNAGRCHNAFVKLLNADELGQNGEEIIDGFVFRLHYKATASVFALCSALVTAVNLGGSPLACLTEGNPEEFMNTFCFTNSTFTTPDMQRINRRFKSDELSYQKYYLWVNLVLFVESFLFSLTHMLWMEWENKKVKCLKKHSFNALCDYLITQRGSHNRYAFSYFFFQVVNFAHAFLQIWAIDLFFEGEFTTFGVEVVNFFFLSPEVRDDPMERVFPKFVKCSFEKFGPSGTKQVFDSLCFLTLNAYNEKIFTAVWFWLIFLTTSSFVAVLLDIAAMCSTRFRSYSLRIMTWNTQATTSFRYGDWFLIYLLGKNMENEDFRQLMELFEQKSSFQKSSLI